MSAQEKIQQQLYTRGREGVFRSNEGLDTVAKSPSLDNNFIKKTLHPFCLYHAPQELRQRGEADLSRYPDSLTVFTADTGELVIGRGVFAGADFTGQRDTIFVHQYVVPAERKEQFYRTPDAIFHIRSFESKYREETKTLDELDELDYEAGPSPDEEADMLERLGIDGERFKQLLTAVMLSAASNKKVYIALDVDVSDTSLYGGRLLAMLYRSLPYPLRRKFGFTTYQHEPQGKKWINAMVVEKGSIRAGDRSIDKDFVFDFPNKRFVNAELPPSGNDYADFAWTYAGYPETMEAFFEFAEEALDDRDAAEQLSLSVYNGLCLLFLAEWESEGSEEGVGEGGVYEANKERILSGVLGLLNEGNVGRKQRLDSLFWTLTEREIALSGQGHTPPLGLLEAMIDYYRIGGLRESLVFSLIKFLYNGWNFHEDSGFPNRVLQSMIRHKELFDAVVTRMLQHDPFAPVVHAYLLERLQRFSRIVELQDEITFWLDYAPEALFTPYFQEQLIRKAKETLDKDKDRIAAGRSLNEFLDRLYKSKSDDNKRLREFYNELDLQAQQAIMAHIDLERVTLPQLESMGYMLGHHSQVLAESLAPRELGAFNILQCASFLLRNANNKEADNYMTLDLLQPRELDQLQALLQRLLKDRIRPDGYEKVAYAFYRSGTEPGDCAFDYARMLDYVMRYADRPDELYDFLNWSAQYGYFLTPSRVITREHENAIRGYFHKMDRGALNKPKVWAKLKGTPNRSFKKVYDDIRLAQSNPIARFFKKNRRRLIPLGGLLLLILVLTAAGTFAVRAWFPPDKPDEQQQDQDGTGKQQPDGSAGTDNGQQQSPPAGTPGQNGQTGQTGSGQQPGGTSGTSGQSGTESGAGGSSGTDTKTGGTGTTTGTDAKTGTTTGTGANVGASGKSGTTAKS